MLTAASTAYEAGRVAGSLFAGLLLALLLRWLYVRFVAKDRGVWSWWLVPIALAVVLVSAAARLGDEAASRYDKASELLVDLPSGYRYRTASPQQERQISSLVRTQEGGDAITDFEVRRIAGGGQSFVVAFIGDEEAKLDDVAGGFRESGGSASTERIGGEEFLIGGAQGGAVAFRAENNGVVALISDSEAAVRELAPAFADLP